MSGETNHRVPTGVKELDKLIHGFKEDSINLVSGSAGSGKTILAMQFLLDGLKKGEGALYITFEEKKHKTYKDMLTFGWDLDSYEKKGKFVFLEYSPEQVKKLITEGGGEVENIIEKLNAKRIVIDSITSFSLLYQDELMRKEAALALFDLISNWGATALLTSQASYETHHEKGNMELSSELAFEVDSIILLYHVKFNGIRSRGIEVLKMRGTKLPDKIFPLNIDDKGIGINTKRTLTNV